MMIAWIGWHGQADLADEVAEHLLLGAARAGEIEQGLAPSAGQRRHDSVVAGAEAIMRKHVDEPLSCGVIARRAGLSLRQIERRFKQQVGCSVLQRYRFIRMTKAHQLLQQTDLSVTQIALACGFSSPEYFCRLYRAQFDCSPSKDRRQSTSAPVLRLRPRGGYKRRDGRPSQRVV
jgi:AraC family carnitine catabolism transcriptional activator